jgi:hypothetical protein
MAHTKALLPALIVLSIALVYYSALSNSGSSPQNLQTQLEAPALCMGFLPYSIWNNPQVDYYNWYGLEGKSLTGKTYLTGHAFERHVAVNNACTLEQKQQNKTVFLNLTEFQKAASRIPCSCDLSNHTSFTYDYNGQIASASEYIAGIDCRSGQKLMFPAYFVEFKRAIKNPHPVQSEYMNSNFVTIWTFYPKRS